MVTQARIRSSLRMTMRSCEKGCGLLIEAKPDMELVGEAEDGERAVALAGSLQPDVVLLDLVMPGMNGIQAVREIVRAQPQARILIFTSFGNDADVFAAIRAGALGYLLKACRRRS